MLPDLLKGVGFIAQGDLKGAVMMKIEVLGMGCDKCKKLLANAETAVKDSGANAEVVKVDEIDKIMTYGVMTTPVLVVDGRIVSAGKVLSPLEIRKFIM